jgi:hypothetical protein
VTSNSAIDGFLLAGDFLDADLGDAAEHRRRQWPALGLHHYHAGRGGQPGANGADDAIAHQHVAVLDSALRSGGVDGGVAHQ